MFVVRYIPVEGEVKQGSNVPVFKGGELQYFQLDTPEKLQLFKDLKGSVELGIKPAKLFLCSTDIRPGDKLKECNEDGIERTVHHFETVLPYGVFVFDPWPSDDEKWIQANLAFKVIGEVSPEASWVKEGMEFSEEDFKTDYDDYVEGDSREPRTDEEIDDYKKIIRESRRANQKVLFRCPLSPNHFH